MLGMNNQLSNLTTVLSYSVLEDGEIVHKQVCLSLLCYSKKKRLYNDGYYSEDVLFDYIEKDEEGPRLNLDPETNPDITIGQVEIIVHSSDSSILSVQDAVYVSLVVLNSILNMQCLHVNGAKCYSPVQIIFVRITLDFNIEFN